MRRYSAFYLSLFLAFILGIHEGRVALWEDSDREPAVVFPYPVKLLPEEDQRALKKGIRADTEQELARLLEDFLS